MNIGKIPENVLKRSILKKIDNKRSEVLTAAAVGSDCASLQLNDADNVVFSTNPVTVNISEPGFYAVNSAVNNIAAAGAEPIGILVTEILPTDTEEGKIKALTEEFKKSADLLNIDILGGHTEISDAVTRPVISVTAVGRKSKDISFKKASAVDHLDVVVSKYIGLEGTSILAKEKEEELIRKFPARMIYEAKNFGKLLSVVSEAAPAMKSGVCAMHDVSKGGIFAALWELAEGLGVGLLIDLKKIPVKQETIEICNYFDINPYELSSMGCMLFATEDGNKLVLELKKNGIEGTVIGKCTDSNDRVLINGENRRFLEIPKTDELYKII